MSASAVAASFDEARTPLRGHLRITLSSRQLGRRKCKTGISDSAGNFANRPVRWARGDAHRETGLNIGIWASDRTPVGRLSGASGGLFGAICRGSEDGAD